MEKNIISFKNFILEKLDDYNIYHFTDLDGLYEIFKDGAMFPFYDKVMGHGISTTRNKNLKWLENFNTIRLVFDKREIKKHYKIKQYHWFNMKHNFDNGDDYRKYGDDKIPHTGQNIPANQYEERIITNKPLPMRYIKEIQITKRIDIKDLENMKNMTDIPIINLPSF